MKVTLSSEVSDQKEATYTPVIPVIIVTPSESAHNNASGTSVKTFTLENTGDGASTSKGYSVFGFGKKSSNDERKKAEEKTTKVTSKDSKKEDAELTKAKSKSSLNKVERDDEEPELGNFRISS